MANPNPSPSTRIKKGEIRNPKGRPPGIKYISDHIRDLLQEKDKETGKLQARLIAETIVAEAKAGTPALVLELLARTEGKVPNAVSVQNDGQLRVIIEHVGDGGHTD